MPEYTVNSNLGQFTTRERMGIDGVRKSFLDWLALEDAERLRAAGGRTKKIEQLERRAGRKSTQADWQSAQAEADEARRQARSEGRERRGRRRGVFKRLFHGAPDDGHDAWTQDDDDDLESMLAELG